MEDKKVKESKINNNRDSNIIIKIILIIIIVLALILFLLKSCAIGDEATIDNSKGSNPTSNITSNQVEENSNSNVIIEDDIDTPLTINSINGNPSKWVNKDVTLEVLVNKTDVSYSFDNGKTWQENNKFIVSNNSKLNVMVKTNDDKYNVTKEIIVNKIDKEKPTISVSILSSTKDKIIVQAIGTDKLSKSVKYSINNGDYSNTNKYTINKIGTYIFKSKDAAGNISDEIILNVTEDYFTKTQDSTNNSDNNVDDNNANDNTDDEVTEPPVVTPVYPLPKPPEEEQKVFSVTFNYNGSSSNSNKTISCITTSDSCVITTPEIVRNNWEIVGWNTDSGSHDALVGINTELTLTESGKTYYAITKKVLTGTFNKVGTDNDEVIVNSCTIYNKETTCYIDIPTFNKPGAFNISWSKTPNGNPLNSYKAGTRVLIRSALELYTSFKNPYYASSSNLYKERDLSIVKSLTVGQSLYEYENGIPMDKIDNHYKFMQEAYSKVPWLFVPGKNFVLTYETYNDISMAYAVTYHSGVYYFIDLKYDSKGAVVKNEVDDNATLHELAHAWDAYYGYRTSTGRISSQSDVKAFYNSLSAEKRNNLTITEWFAGATTEYYWHYLGMNPNKPSYAGYKANYTEEEQQQFVELLEKYINISMNNYKK